MIVYFDYWRFKENLFLNLTSHFCLLSKQKWESKVKFSGFCSFITVKVKTQCKQEKIVWRVWWGCVDWTPVTELVFEISFWQFWSQRCIACCKASDEDQMKSSVEANRRLTAREIAARLNLHNWMKLFPSIKKIVFHFHVKKKINK